VINKKPFLLVEVINSSGSYPKKKYSLIKDEALGIATILNSLPYHCKNLRFGK
jgi:hypothetical protein